VDHTVSVGVVEGARDLADDPHHDAPVYGAAPREIGEGLTAQQLEGDEERAA
jgi:hypothetical protein